jgi:S1-C subfamily serine protease
MRPWIWIVTLMILPISLHCEMPAKFEQLLVEAQQGDAKAQDKVGFCYEYGLYVASIDIEEAIRWYRLAAEQGLLGAQNTLGRLYSSNHNYEEAVYWYRLAAKQGDIYAQMHLGYCYEEGLGVPKNIQEAINLTKLVAEQGNVTAQFRLGNYYADGDICPKIGGIDLAISQYGIIPDYKEAFKWFLKAAEGGDFLSAIVVDDWYHEGRGILQDWTEAYAWHLIVQFCRPQLSPKNYSEETASTISKSHSFVDQMRKQELTGSQIAVAQQRAKELMTIIERKKQIAKLPAGQAPAADIAPSGYGSGLMVKGGYVVTCWHVVDGAKNISVSCQGKDLSASVIHKDVGNDLAILRVDGADAGVSLSFADSVKLGAQVFTMGFPHPGLQGSDVKFTTGSISGLTGPGNTPVYYQISAPLQSGNSGGPLFDEYGNLVGIVAAKLDSLKMLAATGDLTQNVNYAIKSDYLVPLLKTVDGIKIQPSQTKPVNLLSLVEELKKSVVMIKVY